MRRYPANRRISAGAFVLSPISIESLDELDLPGVVKIMVRRTSDQLDIGEPGFSHLLGEQFGCEHIHGGEQPPVAASQEIDVRIPFRRRGNVGTRNEIRSGKIE